MLRREDGFCGLFPRQMLCAGWESISAWDLLKKEGPPPQYETSAKISGRKQKLKRTKIYNMLRKKRASSPMKRLHAPFGMPMERKMTSSNTTNSSSNLRKNSTDRRSPTVQRR